MNLEQSVLGVDIGGSSIKFCLLDSGEIVSNERVEYSNGKEPPAIVQMIHEQCRKWSFDGSIGIGFPGKIAKNTIVDAPNLGKAWNGYNLIEDFTRRKVGIINDADAAALAMAQQVKGWEGKDILCLTLGTGIGSAWLKQGELLAGTEYGRTVHPELGYTLEQWASVRTMNDQKLAMDEWALRLCTILNFLSSKYNPDLFLLSGGITEDAHAWLSTVQDNVAIPVLVSEHGEFTGSVGAAKLVLV